MQGKIKDFIIAIIIVLIIVIITSAALALLLGMTIKDGFFILLLIVVVAVCILHKQSEQNRERIGVLEENVYGTIYDVVYHSLNAGAWPVMFRITDARDMIITPKFGRFLPYLKVQIEMLTATRKPLSSQDRILLQQQMDVDLRNVLQDYGGQIRYLKVGLPKTVKGREVVLVEVQFC